MNLWILHISRGSLLKRACERTDFFCALGVEQNPTQLDDFCRVLGDKHTMLVARSSHVDDNIAVEVGLWTRVIRHCDVLFLLLFTACSGGGFRCCTMH